MTIRPMTGDDVPAVAELLVRAWRWAYFDIVPEDEQPTVAERVAELADPGASESWVAEVGGRIAGVVTLDPAPGEQHEPELTTLYVEPAAQGAGVGAALHDHALAAAAAHGWPLLTLWVFQAGGQARDFYAHRGWRLAPTGDAAPARCGQAPTLRLVRTLPAG